MRIKFFVAICISIFYVNSFFSQNFYWQQSADYNMQIEMFPKKDSYAGRQSIAYTNNSPDQLSKLYFHLYPNAFQPGSNMDVRSSQLPDPDPRVGSRIGSLKEKEQGFLHISNILINGQSVNSFENGTIHEITLSSPILPGQTVQIELNFEGQVPIQIRRSGRDSKEGVDYSCAQSFPKLCVYDRNGWHTNEYIGREFYGNWGNYDVTIRMPKKYMVAASGVPDDYNGKEEGGDRIWRFRADRVHDFMWAADPDFVLDSLILQDLRVNLYYINDSNYIKSWKRLPEFMPRMIQLANEQFGNYPYPVFNVIQGGDGGMEYPMSTLVSGSRGLGSLVGTTCHEMMHNWYQGVLGFDESLYAWMDEGFTTWSSEWIIQKLLNPTSKIDYMEDNFNGYFQLVKSGAEEALITHADYFDSNTAYSIASYSKGSVTLQQLGYIIGNEKLLLAMKSFYEKWKFKHPDVNDWLKEMEQISGIDLDWYQQYWINSISTIDYGIDSVISSRKGSSILLKRLQRMPMPIDLKCEFEDGTIRFYTIPLTMMRGNKSNDEGVNYELLPDWQWPNKTYEVKIKSNSRLVSVQIDTKNWMADINKENNFWKTID